MKRTARPTGAAKSPAQRAGFPRCKGFSLVEVSIAVVILGLMATGIAAVYATGLQSLDVQAERMLLDSALRSRMERLVATPFTELAEMDAGSETVSIRGTSHTLAWTVTPVDLDGDGTPEADASLVTVSVAGVPGRALNLLRVDNRLRVWEIS